MSNPAEKRRSVNPNLLTGGPQQLSSEGIVRAAEYIFSSFSRLSQTEKQIFAGRQPKLLPRKSEVRYSRFTGEILIPRYQPISSARKKQIEQEKHGQQELGLKVRGKRPSEPVWSAYPTLEHAIGSRVHILERYQPTDKTQNRTTRIQNFENTIDYIRKLMTLFESGNITRDDLVVYYEQAYELLEKHGFLRTWVPNRKDAINQVLRAVDVDSLGKLNPTISRMRLASASIKWMIELYVGDMTIDKNQQLLLALIQTREIERFYLEHVVEATQKFLELDNNDSTLGEKKQELHEIVMELFRHNTVRTSPYRISAFRFLFGSFGISNDRSSGQSTLYKKMFGPNFNDDIPNIEQIQADFQSSDSNAMTRFRARLSDGLEGMQHALFEGQEKFGEYELIIPTLVANGKK